MHKTQQASKWTYVHALVKVPKVVSRRPYEKRILARILWCVLPDVPLYLRNSEITTFSNNTKIQLFFQTGNSQVQSL